VAVGEGTGGSVVGSGFASAGARWAMAYEYDRSGWRSTAVRAIAVGEHLEIGRTGDMPLGVRVPNVQVSRRAMCVSATEDGWEIAVSNRNGALLHPWCQPPQKAPRHGLVVGWPLVAVQMLHSSGATQHWVLLECEDPQVLQRDERPVPLFPEIDDGEVVSTLDAVLPRGLTRAERAALHAVFSAQLQWPPVESAPPMLLKQAAARLGISISGLQDRLRAALIRACALGQDRKVALTDPAYLYALVRAGYISPPTQFPHRQLPTAS
jgi:hypothetical protein